MDNELPEFPRSALEALREPLETGTVTISRAARQAVFPARFQLVAAMNPCPCGWHGSRIAGRECRCTPDAVQRYAARLSGPLLDRIDLHVEVGATPASELLALPDGEPSQAVATRVAAARARALGRAQEGPNAQLGAAALERHAALDDAAARFLRQAAERLGFSARRVHRCQKVARTVADLAGSETIGVAHLAEALQLQRALAG